MFKISVEQLNELAKYLASRPYGEVFQIIQMISSLEKIEEKTELKKARKAKEKASA